MLCGEALVVTREAEWGTLLLGFEQCNRYTVRDAGSGEVVAYLAEETTSVGGAVARQLLRARRPFSATLLNPRGDVLLRVRRPLYLLNSRTVLEDAAGGEMGEVLQSWHLWRRHYDVFLDRRQFGRVRSGLLAWEFTVEDEKGAPLARIDRNFIGLGMELFTDAARSSRAGAAPSPSHSRRAPTRCGSQPPPRAAKLSRLAAASARCRRRLRPPIPPPTRRSSPYPVAI